MSLALASVMPGCDSAHTLIVDLQTDYVSGAEFVVVRTSVLDATGARVVRERDSSAPRDADFRAGYRVANFADLTPGNHLLRVELLNGSGDRIAERAVAVSLSNSRVVTVLITRACEAVVCPGPGDAADATECVAGQCVPPDCFDSGSCVERECAAPSDCPPPGGCLVPACVDGVCLPGDGCAVGQYCDVNNGCTEWAADAGVDAGSVADTGVGTADAGADAGTDAGPICTPAGCNDSDPCTIDACDASGCVHSPRCTGATYCRFGVCQPDPTFLLETPGPSGCVDLGVAHPGSAPAFRRTTTGRPNAAVQKYNQHVSCGSPVTVAEAYSLDPSGREVFSFASSVLSECWGDIYGRWHSYVMVDGQRSNTEEAVYYNSRCSNVRTCSAARTFCSPCRTCDLENGYCYAGATCAPDPTLSITTSEGPGCIDLAVDHNSGPPAAVFNITGRPNSTSTQINQHVSCGSAEAPADVRPLNAAGVATETFRVGSAPCNNGVEGHWLVSVEIDGERSAPPVDIYYFNSACPGINTCASAHDYCPPGG